MNLLKKRKKNELIILDIAINFYDLNHYCTLFLHWIIDFSFLFMNHLLYLESFFTDYCASYFSTSCFRTFLAVQ